jgi:dienelactone hydrolase
MISSLPEYESAPFTHDGVTRTVYRRGNGPGVIVMHEMPGITPPVIHFANLVVEAGFTVLMPHLFGAVGKPFSVGYELSSLGRACVAREFHVLASHEESPIADWLRALCRQTHAELGGPGVGAVGMCFTGNFALALALEPAVIAPVMSQPSLPIVLGRERRAGLHVSDRTLAEVKRRGVPVLGLRFSGDWMCPAERFARLSVELGDRFEAIEIDSSKGNPDGISRLAHSVLAHDFVDRAGHPTRRAADRVLAFLRERLQTDASTGS